MASSKIFILIATFAAFLPSIFAIEHLVGNDRGWSLNFDYQAWVAKREFRVGDKLVFKYPEGAHNVLRVDGAAFQQCAAPAGTEALNSGNDVITLATPGRKWYICGVGKHCASGNMKLVITVLPEVGSPAASPSPSPSSLSPSSQSFAAGPNASPRYYGWVVVMLSILGLLIIA